jgi:WD repeat-containing protein 68
LMSKLPLQLYEYEAPWTVYSLDWSWREDKPYRLAIGSFIEKYKNKIEIIQLIKDPVNDLWSFEMKGSFDHPYPTTKTMWFPSRSGMSSKDLLATAGDYLRIWNVTESGIKMDTILNSNATSEYCAPLTSCDWNKNSIGMLGTSSIDTTCTIWDMFTGKAVTQLIAHDKEVSDIAFGSGDSCFASVGVDGSMRYFDLRSLDHSTIYYESTTPLLRLSWSEDKTYLATIPMDGSKVIILDVRKPSLPVIALSNGHHTDVNAIDWSSKPGYTKNICTCSDDKQVYVWNVSDPTTTANTNTTAIDGYEPAPVLSYVADSEVNNIVWSCSQVDWVAIAAGKKVQILQVYDRE